MKHTENECTKGLGGNALRWIGLVLAAAGAAARGILQNGILRVGSSSPQQLLEVMDSSPDMMAAATVSLVLQALATCAVPIFALLLVEGFAHEKDFKGYALRLCVLAAVCEVPYDLAMTGKAVDLSHQSPVLALVLGLVVLYFFQRYRDGSLLVRLIAAAAALGWSFMLRVDQGIPLLLMIAVLWLCRGNELHRDLVGAAAVVVCSLGSPFYLAAPMGFLPIFFYHGSYRGRGGENVRWVQWGLYPLLLLVVGIVSARI